MSLIQKQNHCSKNLFSMNSATTLLLRSFPLFFFLIFSTPLPASPNKIPRLRTFLRDPANTISASVSEDYETFFYTQTLDHFNYRPESYATFQQKYVINFKYWGGANTRAPIFAYLGAEVPLSNDLGIIGFLSDTAPQFKALQVYIEHRYYGESVPFGTFEEALKNESIRGYFNSAQAITDYAEVLLYLKKNLSANYSPIIVVGGSYGGMLASWFRLKYPHIALGAVASSAPILYFDDITPQNGYYSIVTKDFKEKIRKTTSGKMGWCCLQEASESCYETIRQSWSVIDEVASQPNGLSILSQRFKTCAKLNTSIELKNYLESLYATAAQYNEPSTYPVTLVCGGIDGGGASQETDVLGRVFSGVVAYFGNWSCYDTNYFNDPTDETNVGFQWQTCSEMVLPIGRGNNDTMFPAAPFNLSSFIEDCKSSYGVFPRPHWVTTYYGGHDIKLVLQRFASNIIFSNGLRDPYSSGGVLEDISDSVLAVSTVNGSHCLDILSAKQSDPQWLVMQRKREVKIIENWITKYYEDLLLFKK